MKKIIPASLLICLFASAFGQKGYNTIYNRSGAFIHDMGANTFLSLGWARGKIKNTAFVPRLGLVHSNMSSISENRFAGAELGLSLQMLKDNWPGVGLDMGVFIMHEIAQKNRLTEGVAFIGPYITTGRLSRLFELRFFLYAALIEVSEGEPGPGLAVQLSINLDKDRLPKPVFFWQR